MNISQVLFSFFGCLSLKKTSQELLFESCYIQIFLFVCEIFDTNSKMPKCSLISYSLKQRIDDVVNCLKDVHLRISRECYFFNDFCAHIVLVSARAHALVN